MGEPERGTYIPKGHLGLNFTFYSHSTLGWTNKTHTSAIKDVKRLTKPADVAKNSTKAKLAVEQ